MEKCNVNRLDKNTRSVYGFYPSVTKTRIIVTKIAKSVYKNRFCVTKDDLLYSHQMHAITHFFRTN
jgi:hypothetical protein